MIPPLFADQVTVDKIAQILYQLRFTLRQYLLANGSEWAGRIIPAVVIFFVGQWAAKLVVQTAGRAMERARLDETLAKFLCRFAHAAMLIAVGCTALEKLGVNTTNFTAVLAACGLAVGLALQGSLTNFAAGIMIIVFRPFRVNDTIEAAGTQGIVEEITMFHTLMRTGDNVQLIIPNGSITGGNITNYSMKATRRIDLVVACSYEDDLRAIRHFLESLVRSDRRILADPAPVVAVDQLGEHSVNLVVRPWVRNADYGDVKWSLNEQIKLGFDQHGFRSPPQFKQIAAPAPAVAPSYQLHPQAASGTVEGWSSASHEDEYTSAVSPGQRDPRSTPTRGPATQPAQPYEAPSGAIRPRRAA